MWQVGRWRPRCSFPLTTCVVKRKFHPFCAHKDNVEVGLFPFSCFSPLRRLFLRARQGQITRSPMSRCVYSSDCHCLFFSPHKAAILPLPLSPPSQRLFVSRGVCVEHACAWHVTNNVGSHLIVASGRVRCQPRARRQRTGVALWSATFIKVGFVVYFWHQRSVFSFSLR